MKGVHTYTKSYLSVGTYIFTQVNANKIIHQVILPLASLMCVKYVHIKARIYANMYIIKQLTNRHPSVSRVVRMLKHVYICFAINFIDKCTHNNITVALRQTIQGPCYLFIDPAVTTLDPNQLKYFLATNGRKLIWPLDELPIATTTGN